VTIVFEREMLPYICLKHEQPELCVHLGLSVRGDGALSFDFVAQKGGAKQGHTFGFWMKSQEDIDALIRFFERFRDARKKGGSV